MQPRQCSYNKGWPNTRIAVLHFCPVNSGLSTCHRCAFHLPLSYRYQNERAIYRQLYIGKIVLFLLINVFSYSPTHPLYSPFLSSFFCRSCLKFKSITKQGSWTMLWITIIRKITSCFQPDACYTRKNKREKSNEDHWNSTMSRRVYRINFLILMANLIAHCWLL